ncbi:MAG: hypothetical protein DMG27_20325 [Acidobacteria bacterium]|nr:MAG: hypothetical protein DMG27_20325 [Acidobacteriota bacterium]
MIAPFRLMLRATVPWLRPVPAPGASKVVKVVSRYCSFLVDAQREGALDQACAGARDVDRGDGPVGGPQEAVRRATRVNVGARDRSVLVDAHGDGVLDARGIECREGLGESIRANAEQQAAQSQAKRE